MRLFEDILVDLVNPSPERLARDEERCREHPVAAGILLAGLLTGIIPSIAAGLLL